MTMASAERRREVNTARRQRLLQERREGRQNESNLAFVHRAMEARGIDRATLGRLTGQGKQMIYYIIDVSDDCRVSEAERLCAAMDYRLDIEMTAISGIGRWSAVDPEGSRMPDTVKESAMGGKRLTPLARLIMGKEYSIVTLSQRTGFPRTFFYRIFQNDDMPVSKLRRLAEALGNKVRYRLVDLRKEGGEALTLSQPKRRATAAEKDDLDPLVARLESDEGLRKRIAVRTGRSETTVAGDIKAGRGSVAILKEYATLAGLRMTVSFERSENAPAPAPKRLANPSEALAMAIGSPIGPLARLIHEGGLGIKGTAEAAGISERKLNYILRTQDIRLQDAGKIAQALGYRMRVDFRKEEETE